MAASWRNRSPGDLSVEFPEVAATLVAPVVDAAVTAAEKWARLSLDDRSGCLKRAQDAIAAVKDELAGGIALETGKPLTEARGEVGAVISKIDLAIADARGHLAARDVTDGPHPAQVRRLPRGVAAVIAPFNFPLHLGHGATVAHLLAGNPVVLKPSPLAANVVARYAALMRDALPPGVFGLVQGGADEARSLALDPRVRAVCFTGSVAAGRSLATALAADFSKELALELGGRNSVIVCSDADIASAAAAVAEGLCLTCGQRCNATGRVLVDSSVADAFEATLIESLGRYVPGDPSDPGTKLGPLISEAAVTRYLALTSEPAEWLVAGSAPREADGKRGHYVLPAVRRGFAHDDAEPFSPVLEIEPFRHLGDAIGRANATPFGLTVSVFTRDKDRFEQLAASLRAGNIYANLPTTFSPGTLPFGGFGLSGNGRPGGRGFIRFCTEEQAVQWTGF